MCAMVHSALLAGAVAAAVEAVPDGLARGCLDGAGAAQGGQGRVAPQPAGVGARRDQQLRRADAADAVTVEQRGRLRGDQGDDLLLQLARFLVQGQPATAQAGQGAAEAIGRVQGRAGPREPGLAQRLQPGAQVIVGVEQERLDLVDA
jgi:hypothetical protein